MLRKCCDVSVRTQTLWRTMFHFWCPYPSKSGLIHKHIVKHIVDSGRGDMIEIRERTGTGRSVLFCDVRTGPMPIQVMEYSHSHNNCASGRDFLNIMTTLSTRDVSNTQDWTHSRYGNGSVTMPSTCTLKNTHIRGTEYRYFSAENIEKWFHTSTCHMGAKTRDSTQTRETLQTHRLNSDILEN